VTKFVAEARALEQIAALQPVLARLRRVDRSLADQLRRAAQSVSLNLAEGNGRSGADRTHSFRCARASHLEVRNALDIARCSRYVRPDELVEVDRIADHLGRLLWGLAK